MNSLYKNKSWKEFCQEILKKYNYTCSECQRKSPEVVLQVHHTVYFPNHKPWEYAPKYLSVLCKGCHARRHKIIEDSIPLSDWIYIDSNDLGGLFGSCEFCNTELRYEHYIYHPNYGYMSVGCECADRLTQSNIASKKDSILKKEYTHLQTFIKSPKWKEITKGKFTFYIYSNLDGFKIMIRKKYKTCYNITIIYFFYKNDEKKERKMPSKRIYATLIDAKTHIFHLIKSKEMILYLKQKELPLPNSSIYTEDYIDYSI